MAKIRLQHPGRPVAWLIRCVASTLDVRSQNTAGYDVAAHGAVLWTFWHNRMFLVPWIYEALAARRPGFALTSPSGDGSVIADVCARFGVRAIRGSSSRRGMQAMREMAAIAGQGHAIAITPDGPRGPKYRLNPGLIKLAQLTGAPVMPVHIRFARAVRLPTWDAFLLPVPFSRVEIELGAWHRVPRESTEEECEAARLELERVMIAGTGEADASPA